MTQPSMFDDNTIKSKFLKFHRENPHVYDRLVQLCRDFRKQFPRVEKCAIALMWERLRWVSYIEVLRDETTEKYKLNNNYKAEYARFIMRREPDLEGFFRTRELTRRA